MKTIVLKFGGTSVGSIERISAVAKIIREAKKGSISHCRGICNEWRDRSSN